MIDLEFYIQKSVFVHIYACFQDKIFLGNQQNQNDSDEKIDQIFYPRLEPFIVVLVYVFDFNDNVKYKQNHKNMPMYTGL